MMRSALLLLAVPALALPAMLSSSNNDFDGVVSAVEHRYDLHAQRIPMMGFVSFCASVATKGGVKGMRVAEFDHVSGITDTGELSRVVRESLGEAWQPFVTDRHGNSGLSVIFVQPHGDSMRMLIADYEHGELDVVRMELNGNQLAHWMNDPEGHAKHHDFKAEDGGSEE
jgi:hypothetical protein